MTGLFSFTLFAFKSYVRLEAIICLILSEELYTFKLDKDTKREKIRQKGQSYVWEVCIGINDIYKSWEDLCVDIKEHLGNKQDETTLSHVNIPTYE